MSYDLYFWHQAITDDIDQVLDELADENARWVVAHPSVRAFREDLLGKLPHLKDVIEPDEDSSTVSSYAILTLPFPWVEQVPQMLELAARHGLSGWDPQEEAPLGQQPIPVTRTPPGPALSGAREIWTAEQISGFGLSAKWITRAWSIAGLPSQVNFGEAVGVRILATAMRDGVSVDADQARQTVAAVASQCAHGVPGEDISIQIGFTIHDVTGCARRISASFYAS